MAANEPRTRTLVAQTQLDRPLGKAVYRTVLVLVVLVFTAVFVGPLYWLVTGGLKSTQEVIRSPPTLFPSEIHWGTYAEAWRQLRMGRLLTNTLYYALGALAFQLVFDVAAAYALSKLRPILGNVILGMMLATLMVPSAVLIVPQYLTVLDLPLLHLNLIGTPWAIWLPTVANAFNIFLLKRFFDSVPEDLLAAAAIDGASPTRALWSIVLPMSRPILGVVSIFAVVAVWKDFLWPMLVLPDPADHTLNIGIRSLATGLPQNVVIAALAIASAPTIVFFLIFQRSIVSGLTSGGLKG
ncbi:carbohydrate ABC transporter permease [Streptomyces sp. BE20]|uniref:carbohydrate ABC transporter permease n=1 Tax=unclassified Streptomyces TaxID=2593676 RepID=UPI002E7A1E86|nr:MULTISPECIES: carbohydrate ABC transporter permease [unclassified Streptomyces]MED7951071.1 carbohydrate ABC transporter permease [Streptomyces sp. BE303]MEE1821535.1 carbohydrate ABC transporter permease [Streptomyces sp. BE20]